FHHHRGLFVEPDNIIGFKAAHISDLEPVSLFTGFLRNTSCFKLRGFPGQNAAGYGSEGSSLVRRSAVVDVPHFAFLGVRPGQVQAVQIYLPVVPSLNLERKERITVVVRRSSLAEVAGAGHSTGASLTQLARDFPVLAGGFGGVGIRLRVIGSRLINAGKD